MNIYQDIQNAVFSNKRLLAVLIDPDKMRAEQVESFIKKVNATKANYIFVGGSEVEEQATERIVSEIKKFAQLQIGRASCRERV